jgi:hypothetical protein
MKILTYLLLSVSSIGILYGQNVIKDVSSTDLEKTFRSLNMEFEVFDVEDGADYFLVPIVLDDSYKTETTLFCRFDDKKIIVNAFFTNELNKSNDVINEFNRRSLACKAWTESDGEDIVYESILMFSGGITFERIQSFFLNQRANISLLKALYFAD